MFGTESCSLCSLKLFAGDLWGWCHEPSTGECHPEQSVGADGIPGFPGSPKAAFAPPISLFISQVAVEEGTTERSHGMNGTLISVGQEGAGPIGSSSRNKGADAEYLALAQDQSTG